MNKKEKTALTRAFVDELITVHFVYKMWWVRIGGALFESYSSQETAEKKAAKMRQRAGRVFRMYLADALETAAGVSKQPVS